MDKPAACPRSGCLAFEKLNPGERPGARWRAWTSLRLAHPRHRRTRARNPLLLGDRGRGVPVCRRAHEGAQPWGSGGGTPHAEERPRRGPEAASAARSPPKDGRRGVEFAPLWGARVRSAHLPFGLFVALCHPFIDLVATAPCHTPPGVHLRIASRAACGPSAASLLSAQPDSLRICARIAPLHQPQPGCGLHASACMNQSDRTVGAPAPMHPSLCQHRDGCLKRPPKPRLVTVWVLHAVREIA